MKAGHSKKQARHIVGLVFSFSTRFSYTFLSLNVPTIRNDREMIININVCEGRKGMARKLRVARQPAAVIGKPVK